VNVGELRVLDGGNRFNVYPVARAVRRYTPNLTASLGRICLSRAFTCYQMAALLAKTPADGLPILVIDLLALAGGQHLSSQAPQPVCPGGGEC